MKFMVSYILIMLTVISLIFFSCVPQQQESVFLEIRDHNIHVNISGEGIPVILMHGGYLSLDMWTSQIEMLNKNDYKTIAFSDIGHGETVNGESEIYSREIISAIINTYLQANEEVALVGLSWGAMLSVDYALAFPKQINKLVLVSPGLHGWNYFQDSLAGANYERRKLAMEQDDTTKAIELFHQNWVIGPRRNKNEVSNKVNQIGYDMIAQTMKQHWKANWSKLDSMPAIDKLASIKVPTKIIIGHEDAIDILQIGEIYNQRIPNSEKIELNDVAHLLTIEARDKFNEILFKFLAE